MRADEAIGAILIRRTGDANRSPVEDSTSLESATSWCYPSSPGSGLGANPDADSDIRMASGEGRACER
jgi:hypothetical protein